MKKKLIFLCLLLFIAYILTAPKDAVNAASVGLVLWYTRVLPTLLPFVILSNILMDSNYLQYLNKITACIPAHSGQRQRGFCSVKRLSVRLPDREQKLRRPACKRKNHTPGSRCFIYHYQQHQSGLCHKLHPLHPAQAVPSVGSYPADPVFSGAFAGQYPALYRRTPHKRPHRVPRAKTAGIWISNEF